jgi:glucose uptake protein GlcU
MVTLAVILGIEALILLVGGVRVVSKKAMATRTMSHEDVGPVKA